MQKVLTFASKISPEWKDLENKARQLYHQTLYSEALTVSQQALDIAADALKDDPHRHDYLIQIMLLQADIYTVQEQYDEALSVFDNALEISQNITGGFCGQYAPSIFLEKAKILLKLSRDDEAEQCSHKMISCIDNIDVGPKEELLVELAKIYESRKKFYDAEILYEAAMERYMKTQRPITPKTQKILKRIATFYSTINKAERATIVENYYAIKTCTL